MKTIFYYKKYRSIFNENIDQFCMLEKFRYVLMKIQICFCLEKILDLYL